MLGPIKIYRGDPLVRTIVFKKKNGEPVSITSFTLRFTVRKTVDLKRITNLTTDTDENGAIISKVLTPDDHSDPANGVTVLNIPGSETNIPPGDYSYDIYVTDGANINGTLGVFPFIIDPDVTRTS